MTETLNDARHAVAYVDDKPVLELAADHYIYPINTLDDRFKLYVAMKAYQPYSVKKIYDLVLPRRKQRTATERSVEIQDLAPIRDFVLDHFIFFSGAQLEDGSEASVEMQKQWLEENPSFLERIFRFGLDAVGPSDDFETLESGTGKAILVFGQKEHRIKLEMRLYSPERKQEERIKLTAILEKLTQSDKHKYDKAIAIIENSRRNETYLQANWDVIEQLCNHKLRKLENAVINGEACEESNRDSWIKQLPLIAKIYIMGQANQEIDLKNG